MRLLRELKLKRFNEHVFLKGEPPFLLSKETLTGKKPALWVLIRANEIQQLPFLPKQNFGVDIFLVDCFPYICSMFLTAPI